MRIGGKTGRLLLCLGTGLALPQHGWSDFEGGILVFAWDSRSGTTPPPSTTADLDGSESLDFGTNYVTTFSGYFEAGTHTVSVSTEANGYMLRPSPTDPNAVNDPGSAYGNPRHVKISEATNIVPVSFMFDPVVRVSAEVRNAWTMERIDRAAIEFIFEGATGDVAVCKYPSTATYASNWVSDAEGGFPANTILYLRDYDLAITKSGYLPYIEANVISNALPGDAIDLGTIFMEPEDTNANLIADDWEAAYFGDGSTVVAGADADADGMSNLAEYIAGTDPTNGYSRLSVESDRATNGFALAWHAEPDRTYRVCGTTNLCADTWVQVGGPWEATTGECEMVWVETNQDLSWNSAYRIEVVPCWWQGTNQVLVNTNMPSSGGGTNVWAGGPPPLPGG